MNPPPGSPFPPPEPSQASTGTPHADHHPQTRDIPHSATYHGGAQHPHHAPCHPPHHPVQYPHYRGSYSDSLARPSWWSGWTAWPAPGSMHPAPPPPPPATLMHAGAVGGGGSHYPPPPASFPYQEDRRYRAYYDRCYRRGRRGPRLFPILAFGAIVFFATRHYTRRQQQHERERYMSEVGIGPMSSASSPPWEQRREQRGRPWHWHDRGQQTRRQSQAEKPEASEDEQPPQKTNEEVWAEQWAKATGRLPKVDKPKHDDAPKWV
ncbi:hypothetical protein JCM3774_004652 [Rhodotorula dairenensis]